MVISVGVTGHRLGGLEKNDFDLTRVRKEIHRALEMIHETVKQIVSRDLTTYGEQPPLLRVISPLAEGADRLVAKEGLTIGYQLHSPLPFPREEYEKDFASQESKNDFEALLERAASVLELDGIREQANQAYEAVGRQVLVESDALIAIWNGEPAAGRGGTGQIVREALSRGIPTIWISPHDPICLLEGIHPNRRENIELLSRRIEAGLSKRP